MFLKWELMELRIYNSLQNDDTTRFVSYKDIKALMVTLKKVYAELTKTTAFIGLDSFDEKWHGKYPKISISW